MTRGNLLRPVPVVKDLPDAVKDLIDD